MNAIEIEDLRVSYTVNQGLVRREHIAVDGLSMSVPEGSIFGFIGANGAGKSSTMRCLVGLKRKFSGTISVLGRPIPNRLDDVIDRVGAIIDCPSLDSNLTARQHLQFLCESRGFPVRRVDESLSRVGLSSRADSKVRTFSLGMRQRLAIGATLAKDADVMILDEPGNGLDPVGIHDMRSLFKDLANEGKTIFISSHQIGELQQVCRDIAIINEGRCIWNGPLQHLVSESETRFSVAIAGEVGSACDLLTASGAVTRESGGELIVGGLAPEDITRVLADGGIYLRGLHRLERNLEDVVLSLISPTADGGSTDQASSPTVISTPPTRSANRL